MITSRDSGAMECIYDVLTILWNQKVGQEAGAVVVVVFEKRRTGKGR
jgi:hypothetical protein